MPDFNLHVRRGYFTCPICMADTSIQRLPRASSHNGDKYATFHNGDRPAAFHNGNNPGATCYNGDRRARPNTVPSLYVDLDRILLLPIHDPPSALGFLRIRAYQYWGPWNITCRNPTGSRVLRSTEHTGGIWLDGNWAFFMIVDIVLLLAWRLVFQPSHSGEPSAVFCSGSTDPCRIQTGDTCWDIAQGHGFSVDELQAAKRELVCSKLIPGGVMGPPSGSSENSRWKWLVVYHNFI
ncbi:hypothetical protein PHLCEN_2v2926 [Hermanssonia centrifuga]|uniref:LysM domain-containing protein n=1 Tax=Hermanssonia centrifuga TaxID=98765 RepID=A0A2R6RIF5_9APHY|nr:hypothetical protein PHLCEN_2v2926 [Hermanssonia centrifuga]